jgi:nitrate reductase delta subunit
MANALKALSALLTYPTDDLKAATGAIGDTLESDPALPAGIRRRLHALIGELGTGDIYDLQEQYILLFDRTRSLSLHLFEHVHGESRDRGQAMIDLKAMYEKHGLFIDAAELPDYLPMFLEFLSAIDPDESRGLLGQTVHILEALRERLEKRDSHYAAIFAALVLLAGPGARDEKAAAALVAEQDIDPADLAALDQAWEDAPVIFGPEAAPGCKESLVARLRAAKRPAASVA